VIAAGAVNVAVRAATGEESVVNQQSAGEYFGEMALLTEAPRSATVRARESTVLLRLDRKGFMNLIESQPRMAGTIISTVSERLRRSDSARVASEAALAHMLSRFLDALPPRRRECLLQACLFEAPTEELLTTLFGSEGSATWVDLLEASAAEDQPVARVISWLRDRYLALEERDAIAATAAEMVETLVRTDIWAAALELEATYGRRDQFLALLGRALRAIPKPPLDQLRRWLERVTFDEAGEDIELALACAQLFRERGDEDAAAQLERKAATMALATGAFAGSGRLAEVLAGIVRDADQPAGVMPVPARKPLLASRRTLALLGAAGALTAAATAIGHDHVLVQFLLLLAAAIVLWVGNVAADSYVALGLLVAWILLGIAKPQEALAGFGNTTWIFVVAVLALAVAVARSGLLFRIGLLLIRRMPGSLFGQSVTLTFSGILLTPLLPMAQGRASILFPLTKALAETLELEDRDARGAVLGLSAWIGSAPMTFLFLNGAPFALLAWGLMPAADKNRFNWLYWTAAALPLGLIAAFGSILLLFLMLRPKKVSLPPRAKLDLELAVLGKPRAREIAMGLVLVLTIVGWILAGPLGIDVGVVAVLGVLGAVATGNLGQKNLKDVDWNFLLFYGAALSLGGVAVALGLDKTIGRSLESALGFANGTPLAFILAMAVLSIGAQMVISKSQAVLLLSLVLLPLAPAFGVDPWIAAIVILATSSMWYYRAQTSSYALAWSITEGRLYSENQGRLACLAFTASLFVGLAVSVPYWHALGLL